MSNKKLRVKLIIILLIIVLLTVYFLTISSRSLAKICAGEVKSRVIGIVNESNAVLRTNAFFYENFFQIQRNESGDVDVITANAPLINQLSMIIQTETQNRLNALRETDIYLPIGVLTGNSFLANYGSTVKFKARTVSNCHTKVSSVFTSIEINQTLHRLLIETVVDIEVSVPAGSDTQQVAYAITIAETVIVGKIPDVYINQSDTSLDYLDLLPFGE